MNVDPRKLEEGAFGKQKGIKKPTGGRHRGLSKKATSPSDPGEFLKESGVINRGKAACEVIQGRFSVFIEPDAGGREPCYRNKRATPPWCKTWGEKGQKKDQDRIDLNDSLLTTGCRTSEGKAKVRKCRMNRTEVNKVDLREPYITLQSAKGRSKIAQKEEEKEGPKKRKAYQEGKKGKLHALLQPP